jgi:hypothetical protein
VSIRSSSPVWRLVRPIRRIIDDSLALTGAPAVNGWGLFLMLSVATQSRIIGWQFGWQSKPGRLKTRFKDARRRPGLPASQPPSPQIVPRLSPEEFQRVNSPQGLLRRSSLPSLPLAGRAFPPNSLAASLSSVCEGPHTKGASGNDHFGHFAGLTTSQVIERAYLTPSHLGYECGLE